MEEERIRMNGVARLTGRVVTPESPDYTDSRQEYNRAVQKFPLAIVYCRSRSDVKNAVVWSVEHNVPLRVRNGGHNYEGYSTGDGVLVIDLSPMNGLSLDERSRLVRVQGGVTNRKLYEFISSRGYPFPGGTCPTVGVSGYALGGGWGFSCRRLGLGCDSLVELEMVNYEGLIKKASLKENPELFWACRGAGGGNFGVVISMTFRLPPKTGKVTLVGIAYRHTSQEKQARFLQAWQDWLAGADERITLQARIYNSPEDGLAIAARGIFYGTPAEARRSIQPLLGLGGQVYSLRYMTFLQAVTAIGATYPPSEKFQSASGFVTESLSPSNSTKLVGLIRERPRGSVYTGLSLYALGGEVARVSRNATAFFYRRAQYVVWLDTVFEDLGDTRANAAWIREKFGCLSSVTEGAYVNFPYAGLPDYLQAYYGSHVERLLRVKEKYDPFDIFRFPQGLGSVLRTPTPDDNGDTRQREPEEYN